MAHGEALVRQALDRVEQSVRDTVRDSLNRELADVVRRLEALEADVAQLRERQAPASGRAARTAKAKPADDADLPVEASD